MHNKVKVGFIALTLCLLSVFVLGFLSTLTFAETIVLGTEDPTDGFVGEIPPGHIPIATVASDGEAYFDPFGAGYDTSDGIRFDPLYTWIANNSGGAFDPGFWTQIDPYTWVLPANTPCGGENEPACEPAATWYLPDRFWVPDVDGDILVILEENGQISDKITLANAYGPDGWAQLTFQSDPIPEPSTILLLGAGLAGVGLLRKRFKK